MIVVRNESYQLYYSHWCANTLPRDLCKKVEVNPRALIVSPQEEALTTREEKLKFALSQLCRDRASCSLEHCEVSGDKNIYAQESA